MPVLFSSSTALRAPLRRSMPSNRTTCRLMMVKLAIQLDLLGYCDRLSNDGIVVPYNPPNVFTTLDSPDNKYSCQQVVYSC